MFPVVFGAGALGVRHYGCLVSTSMCCVVNSVDLEIYVLTALDMWTWILIIHTVLVPPPPCGLVWRLCAGFFG